MELTTAPRTGWSSPAKIVDVHDGDTVTVEIVRRVRVRLKDCWAPEIGARCGNRRVSKDEREQGLKSREQLRNLLLSKNGYVILFVPTTIDDDSIAAEIGLTFGRVVGEIWVEDMNVGHEMVRRGFATVNKQNM